MNENMIEARNNLGNNIVDLTEACMKAYENRTEEFAVEYLLNGKWQTRKCTSYENMVAFKNRVRELGGIC